MKNFRFLSLFLCICLLLPCLLCPASATETTQPVEDEIPLATEAAFGTVCINQGCRTINGLVPLSSSEKQLDSAAAAFAYEVTTGTVVYAYNADTRMSPGTLAKLVLALVLVENLSDSELEGTLTCPDGIQSYVPGSAQKMSPYLKSGEQVAVKDLLHALVMTYANDAAVALAIHVFGNTSAAVEAMNRRVKQIGCIATEFGNISGLDTATSYSSARDIARIMVEVRKNATLMEMLEYTDQYVIEPTNMTETQRKFYTSNYMMDNHVISKYYDTRIKSGMASATDLSGASLVCNVRYNSMELVVVVLGCERTFDDNGIIDQYGNFDDGLDLIKYVCNNFKINRIIYEGMAVAQWPVIGGECEAVGQALVNVDSVVPADAAMDNFVYEYDLKDGNLTAPITKGSQVATMELWYRSTCVTEVELYAMGNVRSATDSGVTIRSTATASDEDSAGFMQTVGTICVVILGIVGLYLAYNAYMRARIRAMRKKRRKGRRRSR